MIFRKAVEGQGRFCWGNAGAEQQELSPQLTFIRASRAACLT